MQSCRWRNKHASRAEEVPETTFLARGVLLALLVGVKLLARYGAAGSIDSVWVCVRVAPPTCSALHSRRSKTNEPPTEVLISAPGAPAQETKAVLCLLGRSRTNVKKIAKTGCHQLGGARWSPSASM